MDFKVIKEDAGSEARLGRLETAHGTVDTPVFMDVGTLGSVKALEPRDLVELGTQVVLGNTYHLLLRPGPEVIAAAGGLHRFMRWDGPILTDSGGFQVFSLARMRKFTEEGCRFNSHLDGHEFFLGPKESMAMQRACRIRATARAPRRRWRARSAGRSAAAGSRAPTASRSSASCRAESTTTSAAAAPRSW